MYPIKKVIRATRYPFKKLRLFVKSRFGWLGIPRIEPFIGYGSVEKVVIHGMVIEDKGIKKPSEKSSLWQNMITMIKRYVSDEISGVQVKISFYNITKTVVTDADGIFSITIYPDINYSQKVWHDCKFELQDSLTENQPKITATGKVLIIDHNPEFGIISDIDDTFLISHSTQFMRKLKLMLFKNAATRKPFKGVSVFYNALQKSVKGEYFNPFFYVSSSEWNLHDLLQDFCRFNNIPRGVLLLRKPEVSIFKFWKSGQGNHLHKLEKIRTVFKLFPQLNFILLGDSGQKDPEIYQQLVQEFPNRIKTIYIRAIASKNKQQRVHEIAYEIKAKYDIDMTLISSSAMAAKDAKNKGLINNVYAQFK